MPKIVSKGTYNGKPVAKLDNGKIIELPQSNLERVNSEVAERGTVLDSMKKSWQSGGLGKAVAVAQAASLPVTLPLSGIANAELAIANRNLKGIPEEFLKGISGQKQGTIGDVYRASDNKFFSNPMVAGAADLTANIGGGITLGKALRKLAPFTSTLTKTDKNLITKGKGLIDNTALAVVEKGKKVTSAYKAVEKVTVDPETILKTIPPHFLNQMDEYAKTMYQTDVATLIQQGNVGALRQLKTIFGKLNPSRFGVEEAGKNTSLIVDSYNVGYKNLSKLLRQTLKDAKIKNADMLYNLDHEFSELSKAQDVIQKYAVDASTGWTTKLGSAAKRLNSGEDTTFKKALETLRTSGVKTRDAQDAIKAMADFERWKTTKEVAGKIARYTILGGAAGTAGARASQSILPLPQE